MLTNMSLLKTSKKRKVVIGVSVFIVIFSMLCILSPTIQSCFLLPVAIIVNMLDKVDNVVGRYTTNGYVINAPYDDKFYVVKIIKTNFTRVTYEYTLSSIRENKKDFLLRLDSRDEEISLEPLLNVN